MQSKLAAAFLLAVAGATPALAQHLSSPENLVITPGGALFVESGNGVASFQADGTYVGTFATGSGHPYRLAIDRNQDLFVGMRDTADVQVYTLSGQLLRTMAGEAGSGLGVTSADDVVAIQGGTGRLFSKKGVLLQTFTQDKQGRAYAGGVVAVIGTAMYCVSDPSSGPSIADTVSVASILAGLPREREHFTNAGSPLPRQVAVDARGAYYIGGGAGTVSVYSHPGALLLSIPGLAGPSGIAVDPSGTIYVAERDANDVKVFDAAGTLVNTIR